MLFKKPVFHCSCQSCQLVFGISTSQPRQLRFPPIALAEVLVWRSDLSYEYLATFLLLHPSFRFRDQESLASNELGLGPVHTGDSVDVQLLFHP